MIFYNDSTLFSYCIIMFHMYNDDYFMFTIIYVFMCYSALEYVFHWQMALYKCFISITIKSILDMWPITAKGTFRPYLYVLLVLC